MCSMKDEGGPLETGVEARASNRHELLRHNGCGGERQWKSRNNEFGRCDAWRRAKANRPMTYREDFTRCQNQGRLRVLGIRTAEASLLAVRHPVYRRREHASGFHGERGKPYSNDKGKGTSASTRGR